MKTICDTYKLIEKNNILEVANYQKKQIVRLVTRIKTQIGGY